MTWGKIKLQFLDHWWFWFSISLIFNSFIWFYISIKSEQFNELIALSYNVHSGVDSVGSWQELYFKPNLGLIILGINFVLAFFLRKKVFLLAYILSAVTFFCQILLGLNIYFITLIN